MTPETVCSTDFAADTLSSSHEAGSPYANRSQVYLVDEVETAKGVVGAKAPAAPYAVSGKPDLGEWRTARIKAVKATDEGKSVSKGAWRTLAHMVKARDAMDGRGMFMSPRRLTRELGLKDKNNEARTVRRHLGECITKGVLVRRYRQHLPGGKVIFVDTPGQKGGRDTTPTYWINPKLGIEPGYVHPEENVHPKAGAEACPPQMSTSNVHPRSSSKLLPKEESLTETPMEELTADDSPLLGDFDQVHPTNQFYSLAARPFTRANATSPSTMPTMKELQGESARTAEHNAGALYERYGAAEVSAGIEAFYATYGRKPRRADRQDVGRVEAWIRNRLEV